MKTMMTIIADEAVRIMMITIVDRRPKPYGWPEAGAIRLTMIDDGRDDCRWLFLFRFLFSVLPCRKCDMTPAVKLTL